MDVRAGGSWRFVVPGPDGSETAFRGTYREVTPPERIVQTFEWEGMPGHVAVDRRVRGPRRPHEGDHDLALSTPTEERDGMLASGMEGGLNETYARLDELLERLG